MKIAYLTSEYARESDTFIRNEVLALRSRGHVVETFSVRRPRGPVTSNPEVAAEQASTCYILSTRKHVLLSTIVLMALSRPRRVLHALVKAMQMSPDGVRPRAMHCIYWLEAVFLASRLRRLRIDILHNHIAENSATVALLASAISEVPFSMTVHGPGIFFHPEQWALKEKIASAAFTACITNFCKSQCMLYSDMVDWPRLKVIRCGVGRQFETSNIAEPPDTCRLLFVGRLCAEKGLPLLLEAVARIVAGGGKCELAIVGDGPLRGYVDDFVARSGLARHVRMLGWRSSTEIADELSRSRALVLPSFAEGLPVVIMEAMALGRPVITTAIAGVPELVQDGRNGWLIAPGSVDELTEAIAAAMTASIDSLRAMGGHGVAMVRRFHDLDSEVAKLEASLQAAAFPGRRAEPATGNADAAHWSLNP